MNASPQASGDAQQALASGHGPAHHAEDHGYRQDDECHLEDITECAYAVAPHRSISSTITEAIGPVSDSLSRVIINDVQKGDPSDAQAEADAEAQTATEARASARRQHNRPR